MTTGQFRHSWLALLLLAMLSHQLPAAIVQTGNVSPNVSTWTSSTDGYIGNTSDGSVTVNAGSLLASKSGALGYNSGATGAATVTGLGSKWTNDPFIGGLIVGGFGTGTLTIAAGGQVSNFAGNLGLYSGSIGTVTVTGSGSKWTSGAVLRVGSFGTGTLTIAAGGQVSNFVGSLGDNSGATGTATVTGPGSKWTNSYDLTVGRFGTGTLTIEDGGFVSVGRTLSTVGTSFINMTTGGMLALYGNADDSLGQFLDLVQGTDAIRFWNNSLSAWAPLTTATLGVDYSLQYLTSGDLAGYTLLTVGEVTSPGLPGDFNTDGKVDAADYVLWRKNPGSFGGPTGYNTWRDNFGTTAGSGAGSGFDHLTAVPEPTALFLAMAACLSGCLTQNRRS